MAALTGANDRIAGPSSPVEGWSRSRRGGAVSGILPGVVLERKGAGIALTTGKRSKLPKMVEPPRATARRGGRHGCSSRRRVVELVSPGPQGDAIASWL